MNMTAIRSIQFHDYASIPKCVSDAEREMVLIEGSPLGKENTILILGKFFSCFFKIKKF